MSLSKDSYIKKYVGNVNSLRTKSYKKNGVNSKTHKITKSPVSSIKKIVYKKTNDTTGYIIGGSVYTQKSRFDRKRKSSKEKWE